ncbi:MAG: hypothetical protein JO337_04800 [Acidimicrobiales bacterium]|nr:hypothetical protein [Acidimicrobiales bacterium]
METNGFTLVEEDDVAFTLTLCREINRIYGGYQDGELAPDENVWAGLSLTLRMLSTLQGTVLDGMPAMRLQVAAAQAREMHAVLFGELPSGGRGKGRIDMLPGPGPSVGLPDGPKQLEPVGTSDAFPGETPPDQDGSGERSDRSGSWSLVGALRRARTRWARVWASQSAAVRLVLGLLGCAGLALAIDVPFAVVALFPALFFPVVAGIVVLSGGWTLVFRHRPVSGFSQSALTAQETLQLRRQLVP